MNYKEQARVLATAMEQGLLNGDSLQDLLNHGHITFYQFVEVLDSYTPPVSYPWVVANPYTYIPVSQAITTTGVPNPEDY